MATPGGTPPRASVLLPVRDAATTLGACLDSLQRQSEPRWECVLVDDGSRDGSRELAERRARDDPRMRVLGSRRPGGLVAALSTGLAACRAPVVVRMDADDVMRRDRLARQLAALDADPSLDAAGCHVRLFPRAGLSAGMRRYEQWLNGLATPEDVARDVFVECPVAHPTLAIRRERLAALGYRDVGGPEDYDLVLRLLGAGGRLGVVPARLLAWRDHPGRLSRTDPRYGLDRFTALKAEALARTFLASTPCYVLWGHGDTGRTLRAALAAHGRRPSHIVELHPGRLGQTIHGAPVVPPEALERLAGRPIVVSVAGAGPRERIRRRLAALGRVERRDFVVAA